MSTIENSGVNEQEKNCPISKSFYVVQENGKQTATTVTPTSIIKTMQLSALKDYLHCYRCYTTFYKIQDLIQHFLDCTSQRHEDYTFSQFKDHEKSKSRQSYNNSHSTSRKMKSRSSSPETQYTFSSDKVQKSNTRSFNSSPQKYHHQRQRQQHSSKLLKSSTRSSSSLSFESSPPSPMKSIISISNKQQTPLIKINENDARLLLEARMRGDERRKSQRQAQTTTPSRTRLKSKVKAEPGTTKEQQKKPNAKKTLPWRCKKCPLKYSTSRELTQHVNAHDGILPYKCTVENCDKAFSWKKSRNRHVEQHERNPDFKPRAPRGPRVKKQKQTESEDESGGES